MPVLSEQMTDVQPRVSTEGKLRTMAFFLAMRRVPNARQVVMTAGRPGEKQKQRKRIKTYVRGDNGCIKNGDNNLYQFTQAVKLLSFVSIT